LIAIIQIKLLLMGNYVHIADLKNQFIDVLGVRLTLKKIYLYVYYAFRDIIQNKIMVLMYQNSLKKSKCATENISDYPKLLQITIQPY
jgi:hypothetical protein